MSEPRTADGVPVKVGDVVWQWRGWGNVRRVVLDRLDLSYWQHLHKAHEYSYSTERLAVAAALAGERRALKRAKQDERRARRGIERQRARLARLEVP